MKKILSLFIVICAWQNALSQSDFREAYVITMEGDTLKGFVDYREGTKNYKVCSFKKTEKDNIISYSPYQIKGYRFLNDTYFEAKDILVADGIYKRIFLEVLVKGRVTLYKSPEDFYIEKNDTVFHRLANEKIEMVVNDRTVVKENKEYVGVLSFLLYDCSELRSKFSDKKFSITERKLTKLIENYNNCMGATSISFKEEKPWFKSSFGFVADFSSSSIILNIVPTRTDWMRGATREEYLTRTSLPKNGYTRNNSLTPGIDFEISSPRFNERLALYSGVFYLSSKYYNYTTTERKPYTYRDEVKIELNQLKVPLGFRYTLPKTNFTPYFNLGISGEVPLKTFSLWIRETDVNNEVSTEEFEDLDIRFNKFGYWGGIGIKKDISRGSVLFGEIRYEKFIGIRPATSIMEADFQNIQILVGLVL